jgi:hypothetical protein
MAYGEDRVKEVTIRSITIHIELSQQLLFTLSIPVFLVVRLLHFIHVLRGILIGHVAGLNVQLEIWSEILEIVVVGQI